MLKIAFETVTKIRLITFFFICFKQTHYIVVKKLLAMFRSIFPSFFVLMKLSDSMLKQILVYVKGAHIWTDSLLFKHTWCIEVVCRQTMLMYTVYTILKLWGLFENLVMYI